jgi:hypothetical protein
MMWILPVVALVLAVCHAESREVTLNPASLDTPAVPHTARNVWSVSPVNRSLYLRERTSIGGRRCTMYASRSACQTTVATSICYCTDSAKSLFSCSSSPRCWGVSLSGPSLISTFSSLPVNLKGIFAS